MITRSSRSESAAGRRLLSLDSVGLCYGLRHGLLRRRRREVWALDGITFHVDAGETVGVIGRNGAGKSTLLKVLAGIILPDRGALVNRAQTTTLLSLQVGFVPYLSGRENVILSGLLLGLEIDEIRRRMDDIVAFAELGDFIDETLDTYSSGMRARLGFASAFHMDPELLLIDEVLGVGDAAFVRKSSAAMKERLRSDRTVVLVSHSAASIRALCDRAVWIDRGKVVADGRPPEVLNEYLEVTRRDGSGRRARLGVATAADDVDEPVPADSDQRMHERT